MPILSAYVVPHPPLIIPSIGKGKEEEINNTILSFHEIAENIAVQRPETIIIISPHSTSYSDYIHISPDKTASGNFERFQSLNEKFEIKYDTEFVNSINDIAQYNELSAGTMGVKNAELDHGTMIPLYFINQYLQDYKVVRVSISGLSFEEHYKLGMCIQKAVEITNRNVVIIASGDLSHKLKVNAPYGFSPEGPEFDKKVTDILMSADFEKLLELDANLCEAAAECGLRSFIIMAGALDNLTVSPRFYSYECPFGVGYSVFGYIPENLTDPYIRLACRTLEIYINTGEILECPDNLPSEMYNDKAGVFVSIKKNGQLRGCIGTISPVQENTALEIMANAISAGTKDPRFEPVTREELASLVYSVDILGAVEPIESKEQLDVKRYGVIVSSGFKRGLLLPNLEGIDSVDRQIEIALSKARILPTEKYKLERFEVVRHK